MRGIQAEFVRSAVREEQFVYDGMPAIAFVGRSNVGKSSLLNRLLGQKKLARTSSTPGRTQMVNFFLVDRRQYFVDLPGYGYARAPKKERDKWAVFIDAYFQTADPPPMVVLLIDGKIGGTPLDRQAYEYIVGQSLETLVVATKIDKVPRSRRAKAVHAVRDTLGVGPDIPIVAVSAVTGDGMNEIWKATSSFVERSKKRRPRLKSPRAAATSGTAVTSRTEES